MKLLMIVALIADVFAIGLSIYSGIAQHRANIAMYKAIKDLHESHDELHNVIKRIG